jgi:guanyl-specific ribonuclease Sa
MRGRPWRSLLTTLLAGAVLPVALLGCVEARPARDAEGGAPSPALSRGQPDLGDARLNAQVQRVVDSFDRTGQPPEGVSQGGRRQGRRGVFENAEGRLPRRPPGYYTESDVWPRGAGGRGPERLVFGREGEVFYSADHYRTFARVR